MPLVCPCPSHRRRSAKPLFERRDTASTDATTNVSIDTADMETHPRMKKKPRFSRLRISSDSFNYDPADIRGPRARPSWAKQKNAMEMDTITSNSAYDQDARQIPTPKPIRHGTSTDEMNEALRTGQALFHRLSTRGPFLTNSPASTLRRPTAIKCRGDVTTNVREIFVRSPGEEFSDTAQAPVVHNQPGRPTSIKQVSWNLNGLQRFSYEDHSDTEDHNDSDFSEEPFTYTVGPLESPPGSFLNQKPLPGPFIDDPLELASINNAVAEIIIPPSSPLRRASTTSFTSNITRRSTSSQLLRATSFRYTGNFTPESLPRYNTVAVKVPDPNQVVTIPKRKPVVPVRRTSRFKEEFDISSSNLGGSYDGQDDPESRRPPIGARGQSQPAQPTTKTSSTKGQSFRSQKAVQPIVPPRVDTQMDFGAWNTSFNMLIEERRQSVSPVPDHSGWGARRRSSIHPLGSPGLPKYKFESHLAMTPSEDVEAISVEGIQPHVPVSTYLEVPGVRQFGRGTDRLHAGRSSSRDKTDRGELMAEVVEEEDEDEQEPEPMLPWSGFKQVTNKPSFQSFASSNIGPDDMYRPKHTGKAMSFRTVETTDVAPDDDTYLRVKPRGSKASFRTVATSQIDPYDMAIDRPSISTRSQDSSKPKYESWCKFPSHTRAERNGPAGHVDKVETYDFAQDHITYQPAARRHYEISQAQEETSKSFFRQVRDLWNNEMNDTLRMQQGTRSSISVGGRVLYPDLELLPSLEPIERASSRDATNEFLHPSGSFLGSSHYSSEQERSPQFDAADYEGIGYGSDLDLQKIPDQSDHASVLSRMYRKTIFGGGASDATSSEGLSRQVSLQRSNNDSGGITRQSSLLRPSLRSRMSRQPSATSKILSPSNSDPGLTLRKSTIDFARNLKLHEAQSHQGLLEVLNGIADEPNTN